MENARVVVGTSFRRELTEKMAWLDLNDVVSLLETMGEHLEKDGPWTRFPLVWVLSLALGRAESYRWDLEDLASLVLELETIEQECEAVPAAVTPTFMFVEFEVPDVYSRRSPRAGGSAQAKFQTVLHDLKAFALDAHGKGLGLTIERRGPTIDWWSS